MIARIQVAHLLLDDGWASPGHVVVDDDGVIEDAAPGFVADADLELSGFVVPGSANLHPHAHHRGLVGYGDQLAPGSVATLWTWRETMYRHLLGLDPDDLEAYATLAYIEMLRRGYTAVGEFHYLHHDREGHRYANPAEMSERIICGARSAGIALTLLPALYGRGLVAEARLLASPVSFEMASTTQAEGIEDRTTMAPLAGRRLSEMVGLGELLAAMELVVAAQAIDLRPGARLGVGTDTAYRRVRASVPAVIGDDAVPGSIDAVIGLVRAGAIGGVA